MYNSFVFSGVAELGYPGYDYPLTATWLQVAAAAVMLLLLSLAVHSSQQRDVLPKSWCLGPGFTYKCKTLLLVALAFAAVMALTNVALSQIDIDTHVLVRSSEIIWVVLFAWLIQSERPGWPTLCACAVLLAGSVMVGIDFSAQPRAQPLPLVINFGAALASGIMIPLLRRACLQLHEQDPTISILEITFFKMLIATVVLLPFPLIFELDGLPVLVAAPRSVIVMVGVGIVITAAYQASVVALATFALATSIGIISQGKVLPQLALSYLVGQEFGLIDAFKGDSYFVPTAMHVGGLVCTVVGAAAYAVIRWFAYRRKLVDAQTGAQASVGVVTHGSSRLLDVDPQRLSVSSGV